MIDLNEYILEKLRINDDTKVVQRTSLDDEMDLWDERMRSPFGQCLKELQSIIMDLGVYPVSTDELGLKTYTPFDKYVTAYALDGDNEYTYKHVKDVCDNYDYSHYTKVKKFLNKLEKLV